MTRIGWTNSHLRSAVDVDETIFRPCFWDAMENKSKHASIPIISRGSKSTYIFVSFSYNTHIYEHYNMY